ncbi:MAG: hypothetical protein ACLFVW_02045 [Phycisphaerae bacterium]
MTERDEEQSERHQKVLTELEQTLGEQLAMAQREDYDGVDGLQPKLVDLLTEANILPTPLPESCRERIERIRQVHQQLLLTLKDSRRGAADKLRHLRQGANTLRAYQDGGA